MERMVEDLLYLSKIESGQLEMELEQTDLAGIVEGAAKRARRRAEGRQVRIEATAVPIEVTVDPHRIEQVLDNLLSNALTHTPNGGQVTITGLRDNGTVRIRVHNTGSFIPEEDRHRIFERFARASTNGSGTGLGLAIAAEIARHHGGGIELDTSETEGTAFTLVIPVHRPVAV
jgi:signal transduction histidine kinase